MHRPNTVTSLYVRMWLCMQGQLNKIKLNQQKLLTAHEMSKTITRAQEMKSIREKMQVQLYLSCCCAPGPQGCA